MPLHEDGESSWVPTPTVPMVPTVRGSTHQLSVIFLQHPALPIVIILMQSDFFIVDWRTGYCSSYQFSIIDATLYQENIFSISVYEESHSTVVSPHVRLQRSWKIQITKTGCKNIFILDILAGTIPYYSEWPMKELAKYRILFTNYRPQPEWKPLWVRFKLNIEELYQIY